jgi:hypothetical protein
MRNGHKKRLVPTRNNCDPSFLTPPHYPVTLKPQKEDPMNYTTLFALTLASALSAHASSIIYNNNATPNNALASDPAVQTIGRIAADDFILTPGQNTITDIHWTGIYFQANTPPLTDNFTIGVCTDASGAPAGAPGTAGCTNLSLIGTPTRTNTGNTIFGDTLYSYSVDVNAFTVAANTVFWLFIYDTTTDPNNRWAWGTQVGSGNAVILHDAGDVSNTWHKSTVYATDFQLTGPGGNAPEPAAFLLFGSGLIGLGAIARKRKDVTKS